MKKLYTSILAVLVLTQVQAQTTTRLPLVEGLTSNTCGPCASFNGTYGPIIENNDPNEEYTAGIAVVKYQMDWPSPGTDPSFNADGDVRRGFYGTTGIPDWYIDGAANNGGQTLINTRKATPADVYLSAAYTLTGNTIDVTVKIVPLVALGNGNRLYIALANNSYTYTFGTNGETNFKHVVRKMLPNGAGTFLANTPANDTITITESYTYTVSGSYPAQGSFDLWNTNIEVVAWVQKTTGAKEVRNATIVAQGTLGVEENDLDDFGMMVYPNPSADQTTLVFDANSSPLTTVSIYNQLGELVNTQDYSFLTGRQNLNLNTAELPSGIYFVKIQMGELIASTKLVIEK